MLTLNVGISEVRRFLLSLLSLPQLSERCRAVVFAVAVLPMGAKLLAINLT